MKALKAFLVEKFGLAADADEKAVKDLAAAKIVSGELTVAKYSELTAPNAASETPFEKLAKMLDAKIDSKLAALNPAPAAAGNDGASAVIATAPTAEQIKALTDKFIKEHFAGTVTAPAAPADEPHPAVKVFGPSLNAGASGQPRVKKASEDYDSTKARYSYPTKFALGDKSGRDVVLPGGVPAYASSYAEKAMSGAWLKHKMLTAAGVNAKSYLTDHEKDLLAEMVNEGKWVGDYRHEGHIVEQQLPGKMPAWMSKTYLDDSTSGGQNLVPYFFDMDLVTYPLLYGELFPLVDLRDLPISGQVKTPTLNNVTTSAGPAEDTNITLETTTSFSTVLTSTVYNFTGGIQIGRDMLADTPIALLQEFEKLFNVSQQKFLDKAIAVGDGSTYPLGIMNTSSTNTYTATNSTAGPWKVVDVYSVIKSLPKQYRTKLNDPKIVWLANDAGYFRMRGISVSSTDARLIYGYTQEEYQLHGHPFKIQGDVTNSQLAFGRMDLYRMWRRKGIDLEVTNDGKTLRLLNDILLTARSRWAGQVVDPSGWVLVTNAPNH